jgi:hypothetical protein
MTLQSSLYIVVEGPTDAQIIRNILGKELAGRLRFFATSGRTSLATVARNLLVHEGGPVLLVMDADTRNPQLVGELRSMTLMATSGVLPPNLPRLSDWVQVFAFVPEIEVIFFEAPQSLEIILGKKIPEEKVQEGLLAPKATLAKLLGEGKVDYQTLVTSLSPEVASILASSSQAQALKTVIESMITPAVKV